MFRVIANSTTADAADMNDDFYWVAQGSILPIGGDSFGNTTSSNLGSSTHRWDDVYCNILNTNSFTPDISFKKITTAHVSADTSRVTISGFNGETNLHIEYFFNIQQTNTNMYMCINGISSTGYQSFVYQYDTNTSSTLPDITGTSLSIFKVVIPTTSSFINYGILQYSAFLSYTTATTETQIFNSLHGYGLCDSGAEFIGRKIFVICTATEDIYTSPSINKFSLTSLTFFTDGGYIKAGSYITIWKP